MQTTDQTQIPPSPFPMTLSLFGAVLLLTSSAAKPLAKSANTNKTAELPSQESPSIESTHAETENQPLQKAVGS